MLEIICPAVFLVWHVPIECLQYNKNNCYSNHKNILLLVGFCRIFDALIISIRSKCSVRLQLKSKFRSKFKFRSKYTFGWDFRPNKNFNRLSLFCDFSFRFSGFTISHCFFRSFTKISILRFMTLW